MVTIESTPEMAFKVYETIEANLKVVRRRLGKPLTLADKVMLGHLDDPENQVRVYQFFQTLEGCHQIKKHALF